MLTRSIILSIFLLNFNCAYAQAKDVIINCNPINPKDGFSLWPKPYLRDGNLCFDISGYSGRGCVDKRGNAAWQGVALIFQNGESYGRDDTLFRVNGSTVTVDSIQYMVEWGRHGIWRPLQKITINRTDGTGVSWLIFEHGGISISCSASSRKF